jgi:PEP-CTERM motif-containing protein
MKIIMQASVAVVLSAVLAAPGHAIEITTNTNAMDLATAVSNGAGLVVTGATLSGQSSGTAVSSGTYLNAAGTYNVGPGSVLSSGNVADYNTGPNTRTNNVTFFDASATAAQEALLDPITGGTFNHFDVTQLDINFTSSTGQVFFNVVFGSEEFNEFVGTPFIDAFGIYLNGTNIAFLNGQPININHPAMQFLSGTELDGILVPVGNPVVQFSGTTIPGINTLTFIVADSGDDNYDTTVFISSLGGIAQVPGEPLPEPGTLLLLGAALAGLAGVRRRRT